MTRWMSLPGERRNKLGNKKVTVTGINFDSKAEASYYLYLLAEKQAGRVVSITLQPVVELQPKFKRDGKTYRAITYTPDFLVEYRGGRREYIDVKGAATQQGELRRKLFLYKVPDIPLRWVAQSQKYSGTGWIDYDELQAIRRKARKDKES